MEAWLPPASHGHVCGSEAQIPSMIALEQHQEEIHENLKAWERKPLLQTNYERFYERIREQIDQTASGLIVEIGAGHGNLNHDQPGAMGTDPLPSHCQDLVCDGYDLPFAPHS